MKDQVIVYAHPMSYQHKEPLGQAIGINQATRVFNFKVLTKT